MKKQLSSHAAAAAAIKAELSKAFPNVKFSVRSDSFSMGDSVDVSWQDGPTLAEVENITSKYQYGHFDGMTDMYEYSNSRKDIPQTKYVQEHRAISEKTKSILLPFAEEIFRQNDFSCHSADNLLYRLFAQTSFPTGSIATAIEETEATAGQLHDFYRIAYELPQKEAAKESETTGEYTIHDYSERAIAVTGDTKPIKDQLKALGGKFNARLSCGAGWIFPKTREDKVRQTLAELSEKTSTGFPVYSVNHEAAMLAAHG